MSFQSVRGSGNTQDAALLRVKRHTPIGFSFGQGMRVLLKNCAVFLVSYRSIKMQSSAKSWILELILSGRSFMNSRKSKGLSTKPCGTPLTTGTLSDAQPSTTSRCERPSKKDEIHWWVLPLMPSLRGKKTGIAGFPWLSSATCCSYPRNQNRQFYCNFRTLPGNLPI